VTLQTSSKWDISSLIAEYRGILNTIASFFHNPMSPGDYERKRSYLPLQDIPLQVYRSFDTLTTPSYATKGNPNPAPDARYKAQKWLLHWRIAPSFAAAMQEAQDKKQANLLLAVANMPLLRAYTAEDANREFFGIEPEQPQIPATASDADATGPEWEENLAEWEDADSVIEDSDDHQPPAPAGEPPIATNGSNSKVAHPGMNGQSPEPPGEGIASSGVSVHDGPLPDDELVVFETSGAAFLATVTRLIARYENVYATKNALRKLGYSSIPGNSQARLEMYRALKAYAAGRDAEEAADREAKELA
jgi:hypothetical protein